MEENVNFWETEQGMQRRLGEQAPQDLQQDQ